MNTETIALEFDRDRSGVLTATAGRYRVEILHDSGVDSPWDSWDGLAPYVAKGDFRYKARFSPDFPDVSAFCLDWTRQQAKLFCTMFAHASGEPVRALWRDAVAAADGDTGECLALAVFDLWRDYEYEHNPLPVYQAAARVSGWPILEHESRGYCQGDYAEMIFFGSPDYIDGLTRPGDAMEALKGDARLYDAWAWGDVYGFHIETLEGEFIDSCWGYFGQSPTDESDPSGILAAIAGAIPDDWHIDPDIGNAALYAA